MHSVAGVTFGPAAPEQRATGVAAWASAASPAAWRAATVWATPPYELFPIEGNLMLGCPESKIYAAQEIPPIN